MVASTLLGHVVVVLRSINYHQPARLLLAAIRSVRLVVSSAVALGVSTPTVGEASPVMNSLTVPHATEKVVRPVTSDDLVALRDIGGYSGSINVSPDGESVAFQLQQGDVATNEYVTGWFAVSTNADSEAVTALGDGGEALLIGEESGRITGGNAEMKALWSPDSQWITYRVKKGAEIQLWRSSRDGGIQEQLTHNPANVSDFRWSEEGNKLFFEVGWSRSDKQLALQREGESGYLFDDRFLVAHSSAPTFSDAFYDDAFGQGHVSGIWTYDIRTAKERPATDDEKATYQVLTAPSTLPPLEGDRAVRQTTPSDRSGAVAWLDKVTPINSDASLAYVLHMVTEEGNEIRCGAPECTGLLEQLMWSDSEEEIYFVRREGAKYFSATLYAWNLGSHEVRMILTTDDWITECDTAADSLVCLHESATTPRKIIAIDPSDGSMSTVIDPNPEFKNYEFTQVETLEWEEPYSSATAGGHLVYPIGYEEGKRYPMVIVQYTSRGFLRGGVGNEYPIHPLAANSFFVLSFERPVNPSPISRGDNYDRERAEWGDGLWERSATLSALEVIVDRLDERGLIDPDRVGITGLSDGAETVWYAMMHSKHFAVAAVSSGGWSPSVYYLVSQAVREGYYKRAAELLPPGTGGDDRWRRISPQFHAEAIDVPILVQVADSELVESAPSIGSLMDAKKPIETYVYPDEYHVKSRPKHKLSVYERSIDWFNFWLCGLEDSSTKKNSQYKRWRKLRDEYVANLQAEGKTYSLPTPRISMTAR